MTFTFIAGVLVKEESLPILNLVGLTRHRDREANGLTTSLSQPVLDLSTGNIFISTCTCMLVSYLLNISRNIIGENQCHFLDTVSSLEYSGDTRSACHVYTRFNLAAG